MVARGGTHFTPKKKTRNGRPKGCVIRSCCREQQGKSKVKQKERRSEGTGREKKETGTKQKKVGKERCVQLLALVEKNAEKRMTREGRAGNEKKGWGSEDDKIQGTKLETGGVAIRKKGLNLFSKKRQTVKEAGGDFRTQKGMVPEERNKENNKNIQKRRGHQKEVNTEKHTGHAKTREGQNKEG